MTLRSFTTLIAAVAALLLVAPAAASAQIPIYANNLESTGDRAQMSNHEGQNCRRGGTKSALRVTLGERTGFCAFRPPVVGRDLELAVTGRLLSGTPAKLRPRAYLAAGLRIGEGGAIKLLVFPLQRKVQLLVENPDGTSRYLSILKQQEAVRGLNQVNRLFLRAFNQGAPGVCRIVARVNGKRLALHDLEGCAQLLGREAIFGVGSTRGGKDITASFSKLLIGVPNPF